MDKVPADVHMLYHIGCQSLTAAPAIKWLTLIQLQCSPIKRFTIHGIGKQGESI